VFLPKRFRNRFHLEADIPHCHTSLKQLANL